ncbi:unnamed protein product [Rhodiola kirilowii]
MVAVGKGLRRRPLRSEGDKSSQDWDKAWANFKKQGKKSLYSGFSPNKYVSWNHKRFEYPLSEEVDPIKKTERSNLVLWTNPRFTLGGAIASDGHMKKLQSNYKYMSSGGSNGICSGAFLGRPRADLEDVRVSSLCSGGGEDVRRWYEIAKYPARFQPKDGCLWLSGIAGSIAYNWSQPNMKTSVKIIHARSCAEKTIWKPEIYNKMLEKATEEGYDVSKLEKTVHTNPPPKSEVVIQAVGHAPLIMLNRVVIQLMEISQAVGHAPLTMLNRVVIQLMEISQAVGHAQ